MDSLKAFLKQTTEPLLPVAASDADAAASAADAPPSAGSGDDDAAATDAEGGMFSSWLGSDEPDPWLPSLSRKQRLLAFVACITVSMICFTFSFLFLPVIMLKARKFSLLFSMGSLAALSSLAMLRGPAKFVAFMLARERAPNTIVYLLTLFGTLYCAMVLRKTIPTLVVASMQFAVVLSYFAS